VHRIPARSRIPRTPNPGLAGGDSGSRNCVLQDPCCADGAGFVLHASIEHNQPVQLHSSQCLRQGMHGSPFLLPCTFGRSCEKQRRISSASGSAKLACRNLCTRPVAAHTFPSAFHIYTYATTLRVIRRLWGGGGGLNYVVD
jgi:hypothetical protein